jgi:hypothetical protein
MVQSQHETMKLKDDGQAVNSENSMQAIGIADAENLTTRAHAHGEENPQIFSLCLCVPVSLW